MGSGIFKSDDPQKMAVAIVEAVNNYEDPKKLVDISKGLGVPMKGIDIRDLNENELLQGRGT